MEEIRQILDILPHRYPILLVDRILESDENQITGLKNVSVNEPHFQGHFPNFPIMPGVLIVEGMAQCAGVLMLKKIEDADNKLVFFASIDKVKFRKPVVPGDQLIYKIEVVRWGGKICKFKGQTFVDDQVVCEAEMVASVMEK